MLAPKGIAAIIKLLHRQCKCARVQRWGPSKALLHAQWKIYRTRIWYSFTRKSLIQKYHAVWTHKRVPLQNRDPTSLSCNRFIQILNRTEIAIKLHLINARANRDHLQDRGVPQDQDCPLFCVECRTGGHLWLWLTRHLHRPLHLAVGCSSICGH